MVWQGVLDKSINTWSPMLVSQCQQTTKVAALAWFDAFFTAQFDNLCWQDLSLLDGESCVRLSLSWTFRKNSKGVHKKAYTAAVAGGHRRHHKVHKRLSLESCKICLNLQSPKHIKGWSIQPKLIFVRTGATVLAQVMPKTAGLARNNGKACNSILQGPFMTTRNVPKPHFRAGAKANCIFFLRLLRTLYCRHTPSLQSARCRNTQTEGTFPCGPSSAVSCGIRAQRLKQTSLGSPNSQVL